MKGDVRRWRVLALLGGLLAFSVLFIHVPAALWAGNLAEFHSSPAALLGFGLLGAGVCLLVVFLLSSLLSWRLQRLLACLLTALGVTWWLYGLLLVGRMHALNGVAVPIQISHRTAVLELGAVALFLIAAGVAAARYREIAIRLLAILNAGLLVATTVAVVSARPPAPQIAPAGPPSALFRFSTRTNVVVVLLDGLQADLASSVIHENPRLEAALDGFVFYKDTLGVAPTTLLSLPAIHSGVAYETGGIGPYFTSSVERSFLTLFSKAGYEASVINPLLGVCTPGLAACVAASGLLPPRALSDQLSPLRLEAIRLLDLSLFRVAPFALKPRIYNGGRGTVAVLTGATLSQLAQLALESNSALDVLSSRLTATDGPPTIKFVHSLATHMPYVIGDDCTTVGPKDLAKTRSQARCGLEAAVRLLERLKKERHLRPDRRAADGRSRHQPADVSGHDHWQSRGVVAHCRIRQSALHAEATEQPWPAACRAGTGATRRRRRDAVRGGLGVRRSAWLPRGARAATSATPVQPVRVGRSPVAVDDDPRPDPVRRARAARSARFVAARGIAGVALTDAA